MQIGLWILPLLIYIPLLLGSRLICRLVPSWMDWTFLVVSAVLVVFNPWLRLVEAFWIRAVLSIVSIVVCGGFLYLLTFVLLSFVLATVFLLLIIRCLTTHKFAQK